jgi:hypothetical protein
MKLMPNIEKTDVGYVSTVLHCGQFILEILGTLSPVDLLLYGRRTR